MKKVGIYIDNELIGEATPAETDNSFYTEGTFLGIKDGILTFETTFGTLKVSANSFPEEIKKMEIGTKINLKWGY